MTPGSAKPQVVYDARWLHTGIGRYTLTLLSSLRRHLDGVRLTCIAQPSDVDRIAPLCDHVVPFTAQIYTFKEQLVLPLLARGAAVFCAPHYNMPLALNMPAVVTIHDVTHLTYPQYSRSLRSRLYALPMLKGACARAAHLVTPSAYTKRMLIERLGADGEKISVLPCAIDPVFHPLDKRDAAEIVGMSYGVVGPYLLCVASTAPHKNLFTLLTAWRNLGKRRGGLPELVLVLPRETPRVHPETMLMRLMDSPGVRCLQGVTDYGLSALYSAALATILPSLEEGFGYPVVESMACGTAVLCSSAASLPEVAGGCAELFAPTSAQEIEGAICRVLDSKDLREGLAAKGIGRAAEFTADRIGKAYASLLQAVIQDQPLAPAKLLAVPDSLPEH